MLKNKIFYLISILNILFGCTAGPNVNTIPVKDFQKLIQEKNVQLIDVRTPEEYSAGHIQGAKNIDIKSPDFEEQIKKLDKKKPVALYCRSGRRSLDAAGRIQKLGFNEIYNLEKGFENWEEKIDK
ncbi:rhodanese-like domain-containing protein [Coprobacter tertius]|uniref:Rhodanese-like domain-containing protein n=1 Tax=Coprobacter tertius TaxID=2944915 RepID=A0ABT1MJD1_9BACT|nr:rhodanese-like domain-containing protein [Coprobacter tertius]MCP9612712.1 rhodanese-like domain-containing protein [Coprobacter tertius]